VADFRRNNHREGEKVEVKWRDEWLIGNTRGVGKKVLGGVTHLRKMEKSICRKGCKHVYVICEQGGNSLEKGGEEGKSSTRGGGRG